MHLALNYWRVGLGCCCGYGFKSSQGYALSSLSRPAFLHLRIWRILDDGGRPLLCEVLRFFFDAFPGGP